MIHKIRRNKYLNLLHEAKKKGSSLYPTFLRRKTMLLFDDDLLDNETRCHKIRWKAFHYLSCLWVLKYRYFVVVVSSALGAVCRDLGRCSWSTAFAGGLFLSPPHTHPRSPSPTKRRPSGDYRYRPARHRVTMLWRDSTKLECRADPRSEWLNRLKRCLSSGSVVTRGFESRSDIFRLQTGIVELRYPTTFYREGGG